MHFTLDYADIADADVVLECVTEDLDTKHTVYRQIHTHCKTAGVVASATSVFHPDDLAQDTGLEEILLVVHPFNPPHAVPFIEVVQGAKTWADATDLIKTVMEACGRYVIVMKKAAPGFIVNRLQHPLFREAYYLLENGYADARDVDAAMHSFMPCTPRAEFSNIKMRPA